MTQAPAGEPNLQIDPAVMASILGQDVRIWAREERKAIFAVNSYEDDRGLLLEERIASKGDHTAQHPHWRIRIVISDEQTGRRFIHWETVENAENAEDAFSQYSTERIQAIVQKVIEDMVEAQKAQQAALTEAARKATGKIQPARQPGVVVPGNFKHRRGH